jgi:hypothetical protein
MSRLLMMKHVSEVTFVHRLTAGLADVVVNGFVLRLRVRVGPPASFRRITI